MTHDTPPLSFSDAIRPLWQWCLGPDKATRWRVTAVTLCLAVYLACCYAAHHVLPLDIVRPWLLPVLLVVVVPSNLVFLYLIRSGRSRHRSDPALMIPQNVLALTAISLAYVAIRPEHRGLVMGLLTLVIVFGMYTHTPKQSLVVGAMAMGLLVLCMLVLSYVDPGYYPVNRELIRFELLAGTLPVLVYASNQLAVWRERLRIQRAELTTALAKVQELATRDSLTGLYNRRHMQDLLDASVQRLERYGERFSVAIIDLDHFKRINDTLGHRCGDEVLASFAKIAASVLRESDVVARWGGEEFLMLFPNSTTEQGLVPLARLQTELRNAVVSELHPQLRVRFSAGLAVHVACASLGQTLERADNALYEAKRQGRDQVQVAGLSPSALEEMDREDSRTMQTPSMVPEPAPEPAPMRVVSTPRY